MAGARIAPGASLDDGLLDAIIVDDSGLIARSGTRAISRSRPNGAAIDHTKGHTRGIESKARWSSTRGEQASLPSASKWRFFRERC